MNHQFTRTTLFEDYLSKKNHLNSPTHMKSNGLFQSVSYTDGAKYWGTVRFQEGEFVRHGFGRYEYALGGVYDGQWVNGVMSGYGKLHYPDGSIAYEGEWLTGMFNGLGVQYNNTHKTQNFDHRDLSKHNDHWLRYEGYLYNDMRHGFGKLVFSKDSYYQGMFVHDLPQGDGVYFNKGSIKYGYWLKGKLQ